MYPEATAPVYVAATNIPRAERAERAATEMEALTGNLADTARRVTYAADKLQARIDSFISAPSTLGNTVTDKQPPEPQPGSLGALRYWHKRIEEQAERLDMLLMTLAGIL